MVTSGVAAPNSRHPRATIVLNAAAVLAWTLATGLAHAGSWVPVGPADGGWAVVTHPLVGGQAMISAASGPGPFAQYSSLSTWVTSDAGARWIGNPWRQALGMPVLAGTPTVAWMVQAGGLLRSTDLGRSWIPVDYPSSWETPKFLAVDPMNADEAVAAGGTGVSHTSDGGRNWTRDALPGWIVSMAVDWSTRRLFVLLATGPGAFAGALRVAQLDAFGNWTDVATEVTSIGAAHGIVLAQLLDGSLRRSTDGGATFVQVAQALGALDVCDFAFSGNSPIRVYAIDDAGSRVLRSDDAGASWTTTGIESFQCLGRPQLAADAEDLDRLYAWTYSGVVASVDGASSFHPLTRGSEAPGIARLLGFDATEPQRQWAYNFLDYQRTFMQSTDGGSNWTPVETGRRLIGASRQRTNTLFGARGDFFDREFAVSTDGGATWVTKVELAGNSTSTFGPVGHGAVPGHLFVPLQGTYDDPNVAVRGIYVSSDDGETFALRPAPPVHIRAMTSTAVGQEVLYVGGSALVPGGPQLWRSTDAAASWQPSGTFPHPFVPSDGNEIYALAVDPSDPNRIYAGMALPHHLMRSEDGGATWSRAAAGLGAGAVTTIAVDPASPSTVYVGQYSSGVFRSTDYGRSWTALDEGLRDDSVRQVVLDPHHPGRLYAATDSGLWRVDLSTGLPAGRRRAIEFYHAAFDHYFVSADTDEIAGLDAGAFAGWVRTGEGFRVGIPDARGRGFVPVCRFFGTGFAPKSSHFYTPYPSECETVKGDANWIYEKIAFGLTLPDPATRGCPPDTRPLYRAWNRNIGGAPNHRYNTDWYSLLNSVLAQGWIHEGEARTLVFACVPV